MTLGTVHPVHDKEYDDLASAQAATWGSSDVGKVFRILDEPNYYIIKTSSGEFMQIDTRDVQTIQTTDATETSVATYSTSTDYVYYVHVMILGTVDGGGNAATYLTRAAFKNDSGTLSQIGTTTITAKEDDASWNVDIDASGTDIRIRVAGAAATDINWISYATIKVLQNGV